MSTRTQAEADAGESVRPGAGSGTGPGSRPGARPRATPADVRAGLLDAAVWLVRRHGVTGTSTSALLERSGAARRSLYQHFPGGKDELIAAAVEQIGEGNRARIARGRGLDPAEATGRFVDRWRRVLLESDFAAGCPVASAAQGSTGAPLSVSSAGTVFAVWRGELAANMREAGRSEEDAARLATTVLSAVEGAIILSRAQRSVEPLDQVEASLADLLGERLPR